MYLLLETLRIAGRSIERADYHNRRMNHARRTLFGARTAWDIRDIALAADVPDDAVYKCRVLYDTTVRSVEFARYSPRVVRSLRLVEVPATFDYAHKYADRTALDALAAQRGSCDDVLIVRDGLLTDTSYSNIALHDGVQWYTPARPLLRGVRVASLLDEGVLHKRDIRPADLDGFCTLRLLNAMLGPEDAVDIDIRALVR